MEQLFSLEYMVSILLSGISLGGQLALIAIGLNFFGFKKDCKA